MVEELNIRESHQGFVLPYESRAHRVEMRTPHRHRELELNLIVRGQAEYVLAHQRYRLRPGSLVWLFPGQEHLLTKTDAHFKMYVAVFREPLFRSASLKEKYRTLAESDPAGSFCRRVSLPSWQPLEQVCQSLCTLNTRVDTACPAYHYAGQAFGFDSNAEYRHADPEVLNAGLSYLMITGWHLFVTEGAQEAREVLHPHVEEAMRLLRSRPEQELGLTDLATACGTSASQLSRLFNEQLGVSIVAYKNQLKLAYLVDWVRTHRDYSISEACYRAGFGSYSQFYKIFRQSFGVSPKAYFKED